MEWILKNEIINNPKNNSIFLNEQYLSLDYVPDVIFFRDDKIKQLFNYFKPIFNISSNFETFIPSILVLGDSGTGKTLTVKKFGYELQNLIEQKNPAFVFEYRYINCRRNRTVFSVLVNLMKSFLPDFPNRGFSSSEILRMFQEMLIQAKIHILITLDEINYLINDPDFQNLLYSLSRLNEEYLENFGQSISVILVAQNDLFLDFADIAVKSSLYKNIIKFEKYNQKQLFMILKNRSELALKHDAISDVILEKIANSTTDAGDTRFSIEVLWRLAKKTDLENKTEISVEDLSLILTQIKPYSKEILRDLSLPQKIFILSIVQCFDRYPDSQFITLSQIKSEFILECQEFKLNIGSGNTSLWNHLQVLKKLDIIEIDIVSKNYRGRFSKIFLKYPKQSIKDELQFDINKITKNNI